MICKLVVRTHVRKRERAEETASFLVCLSRSPDLHNLALFVALMIDTCDEIDIRLMGSESDRRSPVGLLFWGGAESYPRMAIGWEHHICHSHMSSAGNQELCCVQIPIHGTTICKKVCRVPGKESAVSCVCTHAAPLVWFSVEYMDE
jgi:hypothetical protein